MTRTLDDWLPLSPTMGPPLPRFLGIYWPWYEAPPEIPPEVPAPPEVPPEVPEVPPEAPPPPEVPPEAPPTVGLTLAFTRPKKGAVLWDAQIYDISTRQWLEGRPSGAQALDIPKEFYLPTGGFLLTVMELPPYPAPGPYLLGPYYVERPSPGSYTWNSSEGKINGIKCTDLPWSVNESLVTATMGGFSEVLEEIVCGLTLESSAPSAGKLDAAKYFVGTSVTAVPVGVPYDEAGRPVPQPGDRVTAKLVMEWATYIYRWKVSEIRRVREYPDSAYQFWGSCVLQGTKKVWIPDGNGGGSWATGYEFFFSVSGNVSPFSVQTFVRNAYGYGIGGARLTGPMSASVILELGDRIEIYAHPDRNARPWGPRSYQYNNWQFVTGGAAPSPW